MSARSLGCNERLTTSLYDSSRPRVETFAPQEPDFPLQTNNMGIFSRKPKPAFMPPELPMTETARRPSMFQSLKGSLSLEAPVDPDARDQHGNTQTTTLGRKISQTIVPAFARKASLAAAERDRNPTHLRMGESLGGEEKLHDAFFNARPHLDDGSDEEDFDEKWSSRRLDKGKAREGDWQTDLGWDEPKRGKPAKKDIKRREKQKRRHRSKRVQKDLDDNLKAFNQFAQNGLSTNNSRMASRRESDATLPSLSHNAGIVGSSSSNFDTTASELFTSSTDLFGQSDKNKLPAVPVGDGYDALDVMADHIFRIGCHDKKWFKAPRLGARRDAVGTGVTIRAKVNRYRTYPVAYAALDEFEEAIARLNPEVAIKIQSDVVSTIMRTYM